MEEKEKENFEENTKQEDEKHVNEVELEEAQEEENESQDNKTFWDKLGKGIGDNFDDTISSIKEVLAGREHVIMVRVNTDTIEKIQKLVDTGLFRSKSEVAAYLISEGIKTKETLFDKLLEKTGEMNKLKDELKSILKDEL